MQRLMVFAAFLVLSGPAISGDARGAVCAPCASTTDVRTWLETNGYVVKGRIWRAQGPNAWLAEVVAGDSTAVVGIDAKGTVGLYSSPGRSGTISLDHR